MTEQPKDGGSAFPHDGLDNGPGNFKGRPTGGMSLRDWFAGQALAGIMTGHDNSGSLAWLPDAAAEMAVSVADALIAALGEKS